MSTTSTDPSAPPLPLPPRSSFSCDRHPTEQYTGFCPSCLCERLTTLDHSSSNTPSSSRRPSSASAAAAIKSLFSSAAKTNGGPHPPPPPLNNPSKPTSSLPELRRTKSFSASKNEALGLSLEPQRKSCDVRVRNTLWSLFTLEDENKSTTGNCKPTSSASSSSHQNLLGNKKIVSCIVNKPVLEETENEEDLNDLENVEDSVGIVDDVAGGGVDGDRIRPFQVSHLENLGDVIEVDVNTSEIVEEEVLSVSNLKPMKVHINLDSQEKKSSGGGFWAAASVFSKKWQKWRQKQKQKMKKQSNGKISATLPVEKPLSRQYRDTQSEIADYGFGRRSCDTDPRFSLDAGRMSFDDPRYSFDEPRASWDGYLIGRSFPRMAPMLSVMEDTPTVHVLRSDMQIPVEEPSGILVNEEESLPGGTVQTREYYSDSSSRRRKSLDRSSSIRKTAAAVVAEIDELKMVSNAKVSPTTTDYFQGAKVLVGERDLRDSNSNSLRDDCSETFELGSGYRDSSSSVIGNGEGKESKKSRRWSWRLWGFIYRRNGGNKDENEEEKMSRANEVDRFSESWQESRREGSIDMRGGFNRSVSRSNSSVSWRNAHHIGGSFGSTRNSSVEINGHGRKRRDEVVLERNRSARYSPKHIDNGLLRFYLTPMRSSRRGGIGKVKTNHSHSIRSVLRLY